MKPEAHFTVPDVAALLPLSGSRQTVTLTTAAGQVVRLTGVLTVYQFAGTPAGAVWVN